MSEPTATERLRALLDERGVEWDYGITGSTTTRFSVNGIDLTFTPMRDGLVCSTILTAEQAIAATLGPCNDSCNCTNGERTGERMYIDPATLSVTGATGARQEDAGTCHVMTISEFNGEYTDYYDVCSNCGYEFFDDDPLNFCPNCGRRIEVDDG